MRFFLLMSIYGLLAIVLESTWLSHFPSDTLRLDFIILAVAFLSFSYEWRDALPLLILYAMFMDVASGAPVGMTIFSYVIIYIFIRTIVSKISVQVGFGLLFWVVIISLADKALSSLVIAASSGDISLPKVLFRRAPAQALLDAVLGLAMIPFLGWYSSLTWEKITKPKGLVMK